MKALIGTVAATVVLLFVMGAWSIGAKMMNQHDDMAVVKGVLIIGGLVGLGAAGVSFGARKLFAMVDRRSGKSSGDKDCS